MDIFDEIVIEDSDEEVATLEHLKDLGEESSELAKAMDELQAEIDMLNVRYRHIMEKEMPRCLTELGMQNFTMTDGTVFQLKETISGSLEKAPDRNVAVKWCEDNGLEELFSVDLSLTFPRGGHNEALDIKADLEGRGLSVNFKEGIHPQTFSAELRKMHKEVQSKLESGEFAEPIPFADLGVYHGVKAEIKKSKKK